MYLIKYLFVDYNERKWNSFKVLVIILMIRSSNLSHNKHSSRKSSTREYKGGPFDKRVASRRSVVPCGQECRSGRTNVRKKCWRGMLKMSGSVPTKFFAWPLEIALVQSRGKKRTLLCIGCTNESGRFLSKNSIYCFWIIPNYFNPLTTKKYNFLIYVQASFSWLKKRNF